MAKASLLLRAALLLALALALTGEGLGQERLPDAQESFFDNPPLLYESIPPAGPTVLDGEQFFLPPEGNPVIAPPEQGDLTQGYIVPQQFSHVTRSKDGFFQKLYVADTYIPRGQDNGLGMDDAEVALSVALPLPTRRHPIVITPGFTTHFLDGPTTTDLPARLYDAYVALNWYPRFSRNWGAIIGITPTVFSDFEKWDDRAIRTPGKILLRYTWAEYEREIVFGALYLDRDDIPWLPAAGVIWTPNPYVAYELIFPRPRILYMINQQANHEDWIYAAGEFAGNSYSVQRVPTYTQDIVTFSDYRVMVGIERRKNGGAGMRVEAGYVFGRSFHYASTDTRFEPDAAVMVRGSVAF